ncbi:Tripartite motif-containing protein 16 [Bagarius yarrelli]|uniref:Tripartite motif-containing protein 16 n=1 Tax=Bagarius yarrelli TaxID=175774 RepID=A0A556U7B7_BAGYA|nr:Tripartite motif-containing protein 16 [Bagarius yarrelli]
MKKLRVGEPNESLPVCSASTQSKLTDSARGPDEKTTLQTAIQVLQTENVEIFGEVIKSVELMNTQLKELLQAYEVTCFNHMEMHRFRLQEEISQLYKQDVELNRLAHSQESIQLLKTLDTTGGVDVVGNAQPEIVPLDSVESGIRSALGAFKNGVHDLCKESLAKIFSIVNDAKTPTTNDSHAAEKSPDCNNMQIASQTTIRFEPTLERNSAYRHIRLSDGDRKATLRAENQNYPEHPDRFIYWRQVLCQEPLAGSPYYWEVEWTGQKVTIGITYKDIGRSTSDDTSRLGHNELSWSLYWSGTTFSVWHAGKETVLAAPKARRIGVYVDQQAGVLAFYRVSHNQAHQICCVETEFNRPLYPGFRFWTGVGSTITICQLD